MTRFSVVELATVFQQLAIALGLGLLVGLQRERTDSRLAGFRTFPLITLLGALCALLSHTFGGWVLGLGLVGLALLIVVGNLTGQKSDKDRPGVTTETAMLLMFAVGACLTTGHAPVAIAVGGTVAVLLHLKPEMHALATKIGDRDFKSFMQFTLITLVVLPVLPNRAYGPYAVLNPYKIWWMVVLIVGIGLGGYVAYKFAGARVGTWANGVLGGLVSSTATTVSLSRRSAEAPDSPSLAAFVILTASAIVFLRVAVLIAVTAPSFASAAARPLAVMFVALAGASLWCWRSQRTQPAPSLEPENPSELKPAFIFAFIYAGVLLGAAAAKDFFGEGGLYAVAALSGLTDMDAITLSVTQMVSSQRIESDTGWRLILIASMSNLAFKAGIVATLGTRILFRRIVVAFGCAVAAGTTLLFW